MDAIIVAASCIVNPTINKDTYICRSPLDPSISSIGISSHPSGVLFISVSCPGKRVPSKSCIGPSYDLGGSGHDESVISHITSTQANLDQGLVVVLQSVL